MNARRIVIGCLAAAAVVVCIAVIAAVVIWRQFSNPVAIAEARLMAGPDTVGLAVLRFAPSDPWIGGLFLKLNEHSLERRDPSQILPIEIVWTARKADAQHSDGHLLLAGISAKGRFLGMMADFALWKAGRSGAPKVAREIHRGEGITSFPGTAMPGFLFVRGNQIGWGSDRETTHAGIDRILDGPPAGGISPVPVLTLAGDSQGELLRGAILNDQGDLARILSLIPGATLDFTTTDLFPSSALSFTFRSVSADQGEGRVTIHFTEGTPPDVMEKVAVLVASRLPAAVPAGVVLEAAHTIEAATAILTVKVSGLQSLQKNVTAAGIRVFQELEDLSSGRETLPDQSSSTFQ